MAGEQESDDDNNDDDEELVCTHLYANNSVTKFHAWHQDRLPLTIQKSSVALLL